MQMGEDDISREIRMKREKSVREAHEQALVEPYKKEIARLERVIRGLRKQSQIDDNYGPIHRPFSS